MLIAEIHGKRFPEAEGQEDWLTSAVFGHLRHIAPGAFWADLLDRARTVGTGFSLYSQICADGIHFNRYSKLDIHFWKSWEGYGEPDLIMRFSGGDQSPLIIVVEVKLDSGKSGTGENDQLKRYLQLLDDRQALSLLFPESSHRYLIYLTRVFSKLEIEDSIRVSVSAGIGDARDRIFGLQWQDVLESSSAHAAGEPLLDEVAQFLKVRRFEAFRGFRVPLADLRQISGTFYGISYFASTIAELDVGKVNEGKFYGN
jgi:hypothetical protein